MNRWNHRFALCLSVATAILLAAGALVTGTGSGLSVPDWPLSFGQFFPPMVGGVLFEHGHRLIAGTVALLTVAFAMRLAMTEPRRWVRLVGYGAVAAVLFQALLGGLTVLFKLPAFVSVGHACLAQGYFILTVLLVMATSPSWREPVVPMHDPVLPALCSTLTGLFFLQLLLGAVMRHNGAGLAIPDFPGVFGGWYPQSPSFAVAVHFAHRLGAYTIVAFSTYLCWRVFAKHEGQLRLIGLAGVLIGLLSIQVLMGAMVIWLRRPVSLTTAHLVVGALCLATSVVMTIQVHRASVAPPIRFPEGSLPA